MWVIPYSPFDEYTSRGVELTEEQMHTDCSVYTRKFLSENPNVLEKVQRVISEDYEQDEVSRMTTNDVNVEVVVVGQ
jgi:hypothetical protein